jgi:hypothetical protein
MSEARLLTVICIFGGRWEFAKIGQHKRAGGKEVATRIEFVGFSAALCNKNSEFIEARAIREGL